MSIKYPGDVSLTQIFNLIKEKLSDKVDSVDGKGLSTNDYTTGEKNKLSSIEDGANKFIHATHPAATSGLYKVTVDDQGHVSSTSKVTKQDIVDLGIPGSNTDTTYDLATQESDGLLCCDDKKKLDSIEEGANKTIVDSALSSTSTNPVQNKAVKSAVDNLVPKTRKINGKALSDDINLGATDVGALPDTTVIPSKTSQLTNDSGYLTSFTESDPTVPSWAKQSTKPSYSASEVGADPSGTADTKVSTHNAATDAHSDIRLLITGLTDRLNALANSDDTTLDQMAEVVAYIKDNRELIEQITTDKVNVSDIINNLTTNVSNKPLSAAQGVVLKALIDAIVVPTKVSELTNDKGYLTSFTESDPTVPSWAKQSTKPKYTASEVGALPDTTVIPSKTSQLTNDSGYITSHQDISGKLDKTGDGSNVTTKFTTASSRSNLSTGEKLSVSFGKIAKWFADLGSLAFKSTVAKTDLASDVQTSLGKADSALQSFTESDPTVPAWAKADKKPSYTAAEVGALPSTTTIPSKTSQLTNDSGYITGYTETDPTVPSWAKQSTKPKYTASEVGADPSGTASSAVSTHNSSTTAHSDIRNSITNLQTQINSKATANILATAEVV